MFRAKLLEPPAGGRTRCAHPQLLRRCCVEARKPKAPGSTSTGCQLGNPRGTPFARWMGAYESFFSGRHQPAQPRGIPRPVVGTAFEERRESPDADIRMAVLVVVDF